MRFKELLQERLKEKLSKEEIVLVPRSYQRLGHCLILRLAKELQNKKEEIGKASLEIVPGIKTVCINLGKVEGKFRRPNIEVVAGENNTVVDHNEHGCLFRFDITKLMWSMGNMNERKRMYENVKEGEIVVDCFAGIGYWSIPICKNSKPAKVFAIDANPDSIHVLKENRRLNHISEETLEIIHGKCEEQAEKLEGKADRVILGYLPAPTFALTAAIKMLKPAGGIIHYEGICERDCFEELLKDAREKAEEQKKQATLLHAQPVKSVAARKWHYVIDVKITPKNE
jgi:tRNA wybutosine-synthesizing protein 2